jgi:hypothetical protein
LRDGESEIEGGRHGGCEGEWEGGGGGLGGCQVTWLKIEQQGSSSGCRAFLSGCRRKASLKRTALSSYSQRSWASSWQTASLWGPARNANSM